MLSFLVTDFVSSLCCTNTMLTCVWKSAKKQKKTDRFKFCCSAAFSSEHKVLNTGDFNCTLRRRDYLFMSCCLFKFANFLLCRCCCCCCIERLQAMDCPSIVHDCSQYHVEIVCHTIFVSPIQLDVIESRTTPFAHER